MTKGDSGGDERFLERERTADHEAHKVVAPKSAYIRRFIGELAAMPHPIAAEVGADVEIGTERRKPWIGGL